MTETPFFSNFDLASLAIWMFYVFFALLIFYIQRENMREGYPMVDDEGHESLNQGPFPVPEDKTFLREHGQSSLTVPSGQRPDRSDLALEKVGPGNGFPLEPTGNPMADGVGPASWANREDVPELDGKGHPKIVPLSHAEAFSVSAGADPRGMPVMAGDKEIVGSISDIWIDEPEQMVRYLEIELDPKWGSGKRLVPLTFARIIFGRVQVRSIFAQHFDAVPKLAATTQITKLEEEKVSAYYGGGQMYADRSRQEPLI